MKQLKGIDGKLDKIWSLLVKHKAKWECEYCGKSSTLNSHHIYSRSKKSTRWHVQNGICLCVAHHTFSSTFSAHKTPLEFVQWLYKYKGKDYIERLEIKANTTCKLFKFEKELLLQELIKELKKYEK